MPYDVSKMADWQIAEAAEQNMPTPEQWKGKLGLRNDEILAYGKVAKLDFLKIMERLQNKPDGKYIEVTAVTPTPLGEGKTTTTMGLIEGLGKQGENVGGAIRQPAGGPTMNIKGTAAGGGNALLIPHTELSLGLTGDINDIVNAHNLAMVALTARMQHERNYGDQTLEKLSHMQRIDIDPLRVEMGWVIEFCAQSLRNIVIGLGTQKTDGFLMQSKFAISVSSELMAILAMVKDLADLRQRLGEITVAYDKKGKPVTTSDLQVAGAMAAWMRNTINPTLCSTAEYQPCFVHAGPFANIAIGQSSIIADRIGLKMFDYHVTESGFAADIGFEKFWNVKCRYSGLKPNVSVLVATIRSLKMHGGGPKVTPGVPLPEEYKKSAPELVEKGCANLVHHISIIRAAGINPVVCINMFPTDTKEEIAIVRKAAEAAGARCAVSTHYAQGGAGAQELVAVVKEACNEKNDFHFLYPKEMKLRERVEKITKTVYGGAGVSWTADAEAKAKAFEADPKYDDFATMMVKTHLSLSHNPNLKGVPKGWTLPIRDVLIYSGAKFLCPVAGDISMLPATGSSPAFRKVDIDVKTGKVKGLHDVD
jgi:formyltetrahydrofolate synthetase